MLLQLEEVSRKSWVSCIRVLLYLNGLCVGDIRIFTSILNQRAQNAWYTSVLEVEYIFSLQVNSGTRELPTLHLYITYSWYDLCYCSDSQGTG